MQILFISVIRHDVALILLTKKSSSRVNINGAINTIIDKISIIDVNHAFGHQHADEAAFLCVARVRKKGGESF